MDLSKSTRPVASFIFENVLDEAQKLCLFHGHFDTVTVIGSVIGQSAPFTVQNVLSYADPSSIKAAGYDCDQVADDFNLNKGLKDGSGATYGVKITPKSPKTRYRDFLNFIKNTSLKVSKIRITDMDSSSSPTREIFNSEMEISQSAIGAKAGSDFIQLASHIDPSNYLQNFIEIDLEKQNLLLDETTLAFLLIPGKAKFQMDFTLTPTI